LALERGPSKSAFKAERKALNADFEVRLVL